MKNYKLPVADVLTAQVKDSMKKFATHMSAQQIQQRFMAFGDALEKSGKIHFVDIPRTLDNVVVGIDGAFATYRMFGGALGIFVTLGAVIEKNELNVIPLKTGADVYLGERGSRTFKIKEYIAELQSIHDAAQRLKVLDIDSAIIFVDGSLSSSIGHISMQRDIDTNVISELVDAVQGALKVSYDVVFVPKRMLMDIAWKDPGVLHYASVGLIEMFKNSGMVESFVIGNSILLKRRQMLSEKKTEVDKIAIVGPFNLKIYLEHPTDGTKKANVSMNTYYINYLSWRHMVLRIDVSPDKDVEWVREHVLPSIDITPAVSCVKAADEYAKRTISSTINSVVNNVFASDEMKRVLKLFPNYRGELGYMTAINYGGDEM